MREADDPIPAVAQVARERGTTYVLMPPPPTRRGIKRLGPSTIDQLLQAPPQVDVRIVADRTSG